jgi:hypothetical protein
MRRNYVKFLIAERLKECLQTPNWPDLSEEITSIEVTELDKGLLQLKIYHDGIPEYYTIKIIANV